MASKPIIFSGPMVRALLEGRKHQTRRVLTKLRRFGKIREFGPSNTPGYDWHFRDKGMRWHDLRGRDLHQYLPYAPGDMLWVREAWARVGDQDDDIHACPDLRIHAYYRADCVDPERQRWRSSMFMPRWASRLTLRVTDVRVQRVQDISEEDAIAEGCRLGVGIAKPSNAIFEFQCIWNSLNEKRGYGWDENPWVIALSFDVLRQNVDTLLGPGD